MKTYLRVDGFTVTHTPDPSEAIRLASQTKYEVVITDLVMRGMSGLDLYREVKSYDGRVRFMFLLSNVSTEALRLMGSVNRDDVIKKEPLSINEVILKVRAAFRSSR